MNGGAAAELPRSRGASYQQLLDAETRPVPAVLRLEAPLTAGPTAVPVERYTSAAFHRLEVERLWRRVWQMACHVDDIPAVGDHTVYEIANHQLLVTRTAADEIRAYHNVCLHRGRSLVDGDGRAAQEFRCPFHGFAWHLDGSLKHVPCGWDFPHVQPEEFRLPEAKVATWGGFVFVNLDPGCAPFEDFVGDLDTHFARWPLEQRHKQAHVAKILRCNWKVAQEAFSEAYHVVATHPQLLAGIGDANSQYDAWGNVSRAITANGTPSPHLKWEPTEQDVLDAMLDRDLDAEPPMVVPEGSTARQVAGAARRAMLTPLLGAAAAEELTDAELVDSFYYTLFPNFHPWGAYNLIVYRFRPYGDDHTRCIMECLYLAPYRADRPKPPNAAIHWLGEDDDWTQAPELGLLARVFNQDTFNLPKVQRGLEAAVHRDVTFANYQETKIRHFHALLEDWLARD